jgi:hypothetical protein
MPFFSDFKLRGENFKNSKKKEIFYGIHFLPQTTDLMSKIMRLQRYRR